MIQTLRIICRETDTGDAVHVGGPVHVSHKTFDVPCTVELMQWLAVSPLHGTREIEGVEFIPPTQEPRA